MSQNRTRSRHPVSSFGQELLEALIRGGERELTIELPEVKNATYMVQRLYELRKRMREENHPQWELASRCRISNVTYVSKRPVKTNIVRIRPYDSEFRSALDKALGQATAPAPVSQSQSAMDAFLTNLAEEVANDQKT